MAVQLSNEQVNVTREVLTADQVADMLGICKQNVYELCRTNQIPHKRVSARRIVFPKQAILKWLNS